jgi:hypothetical protein
VGGGTSRMGLLIEMGGRQKKGFGGDQWERKRWER